MFALTKFPGIQQNPRAISYNNADHSALVTISPVVWSRTLRSVYRPAAGGREVREVPQGRSQDGLWRRCGQKRVPRHFP